MRTDERNHPHIVLQNRRAKEAFAADNQMEKQVFFLAKTDNIDTLSTDDSRE